MKTSLTRYVDSLQSESDRGCVMIGSDLLNWALETRFDSLMKGSKKLKKDLLTGTGPLSTFSAKIKLAYSLEVIGEDLYRDLGVIECLRKQVGHSFSFFSFETYNERNASMSLQMLDLLFRQIEEGDIKESDFGSHYAEFIESLDKSLIVTPAQRFNYTVAVIFGYLSLDAEAEHAPF